MSDEIIATNRVYGHSVSMTGVDGTWSKPQPYIPMLKIVGYHGNKIIGLGYDRRLYFTTDFSEKWSLLPKFVDVESAAIDNEMGYLYLIKTSGDILRHSVDDLGDSSGTRLRSGFMTKMIRRKPSYKVVHVSWNGVMFYKDDNNR